MMDKTMKKRTHKLGDLQLAIMHVLWARGEATVAEVHSALEGYRPLAYTTVATMLSKMEAKGYVRRSSRGRANLYRPAIEQAAVQRSMVTDLARKLFQGDVTEMVAQLLDGADVSPAELKRLKSLIRQKEKEARNAG